MVGTARRALVALAAAAAATASAGCVAVAVGAAAGYGAYKVARNGEAREFLVPYERTWAAAAEAMAEHGHPVPAGPPPSPTEGLLAAGDLRVEVFKTGEASSRVEVVAGTFDNADNRRRARLLLDAIGRRLGYPPPA